MAVIPGIKELEGKSKIEQHETISIIRSQYSIHEVCEAWGISLGTYYNLLHRWGIDLSDVRRRKRKLQKGNQIGDGQIGNNASLSRFFVYLQEELNGEALIHFLQVICDRITMVSGPLKVLLIIELPQWDGDSNDSGLLPLEIFKGLSMDEKVRFLARWVKNDHHKDVLLRSWGIDVVRFFELLGEMKVPMIRVLEEKQQLLLESTQVPLERSGNGMGNHSSIEVKGRLYEFSGGCTRFLLERDLAFLSQFIKQCTYVKYSVVIRIEEIDGGI